MSSISCSKIYDAESNPADSPSSISFANQDLFCVTAWDNNVYFYNYQSAPITLKSRFTFQQPPLCSVFLNDTFYFGIADGSLGFVNIVNGTQNIAKIHEAGISQLKKMDENILITGSWDKTVKFFYIRSMSVVHTIQKEERVYGMDYHNGIVATMLLMQLCIKKTEIFFE
jgi:mRNA export factor